MSNIRVEHNKDNPYVLTNKKTLEIETLSWEAKGLWSYLLSRPNNWVTNVKHLSSHFPGGRDRVRRILKELQDHQLCHYVQEAPKDKNGRFEWGKGDYIIFETSAIFQIYFTEPCFAAPGNTSNYTIGSSMKTFFEVTENQAPQNQGPENTSPYLDTKDKLNNESSSSKNAREGEVNEEAAQEAAAADSKESLEEILLRKLSAEEVSRSLKYLETLSNKKIDSINSIPGFLIRAIKEDWDKEPYEHKLPIETNKEIASKLINLLKIHKKSLQAINCRTYLEFITGAHSKTLSYDLSPSIFKSKIKSLLFKADLLKDIGKELNLGDEA